MDMVHGLWNAERQWSCSPDLDNRHLPWTCTIDAGMRTKSVVWHLYSGIVVSLVPLVTDQSTNVQPCSLWTTFVTGTVAQVFWPLVFFSWIDPIWAPHSYTKTFSNSGSNSQRYLNFKVVLQGIRPHGTQKKFQMGGCLSMDPICLG